MAFSIYKRGQGRYTRIITFVSGSLIAAVVARLVWAQLRATELSAYLVFGIPLGIFVGLTWMMFWVVNRPRSADFMIATEGEMKKVSWSSRREIIGGTKVVIAATLVLAVLLMAVDLAFGFFFQWIEVLQVTGGD